MVLQPQAFVASDGKTSIPGSSNSKVTVPRLVERQLLELADVESGAETMGSSINVIMAGNFIMTVAFKAAMQYLWGMLNSLQITVMAVLLDIMLPENLQATLIQV